MVYSHCKDLCDRQQQYLDIGRVASYNTTLTMGITPLDEYERSTGNPLYFGKPAETPVLGKYAKTATTRLSSYTRTTSEQIVDPRRRELAPISLVVAKHMQARQEAYRPVTHR